MNLQKTLGFTLIELMIVVVIIAILTAVGYPAYTQYVIRGKRSEGRAMLTDAAARQERYYSDCNKYASTIGTADNCATNTINLDATSENGHYSIAISGLNASAQIYTLTAAPQTFTDDLCGNLTLDQTGSRGESGTATNIKDCWGR
jgi:type IV pilus assembly protein PilE